MSLRPDGLLEGEEAVLHLTDVWTEAPEVDLLPQFPDVYCFGATPPPLLSPRQTPLKSTFRRHFRTLIQLILPAPGLRVDGLD
jgi:hypothetical protein